MTVPALRLNTGVEIPQVGFGVFLIPETETKTAVATALAAGYRHIDTAKLYQNEAEVGQAIAESDVPREQIFVTTKVWNSEQGYDSAIASFDESLGRLGLETLDLLLIHWPVPELGRYVETWHAFEKLYADGRVRAIGVSNFHIPHLRRLLDEGSVVPAVNQIELHPQLPQAELREFHAQHGIVTEAWSPLARGGAVLSDATVTAIADRVGKSPAQVVLRWSLQLGNVVLPRSVTPSRIAENLELFDFSLTDEDMAALASLENGERIGPNPDTFNRV
ncbi:MAG: aldo/keto reductase [Jatrophihabitantaceae bacterium]